MRLPPDEEYALRGAIAERPGSAHAHAALAAFLCGAGRADEALAHLDREARQWPSNIWPLAIKAGVLSAERRATEAIEVHETLVAMAPDTPLLWSNFAGDLAAVGDTAQAAAAYRNAVKLAPEFGAAWLGMANLRIAPICADDIVTMERTLGAASDPYQTVQMMFALGHAYDKLSAFDKSFENFRKANDLRETLVPYDPRRIAAFVEAHRALPSSFFAKQPGPRTQTSGAIFIVGMPRAGSTLVEQILASHPEIEGAGELFALAEVASSLGAADSPDAFVHRLQTLTQADAAQLGRDYLTTVARYRRTDRPYFTDKMPANWRFIALLHRILPDARIIDVRRDPLACCFSAYTTYFNRYTDFPNRLEDLGQYHQHYVGMMEMMRGMSSDRLYRLDYERLVTDAEGEIRALLDFLHLPFAPACLHPHENSRAIYTPSAQQVRTPIRPMGARSRDHELRLRPLQIALDA